MVDVARDLRVDFLKLAPSRDFETSSRVVKKTIGSHLKIKEPDDSGNNGIQQEATGSGTTKPVHPLDGESGVASMCIPRHIKDIDLEGLIPARCERNGFKVVG